MDKLAEINEKRKRAHARLVALRSEVYRGFLDMERAAFADGALAKLKTSLATFDQNFGARMAELASASKEAATTLNQLGLIVAPAKGA